MRFGAGCWVGDVTAVSDGVTRELGRLAVVESERELSPVGGVAATVGLGAAWPEVVRLSERLEWLELESLERVGVGRWVGGVEAVWDGVTRELARLVASKRERGRRGLGA